MPKILLDDGIIVTMSLGEDKQRIYDDGYVLIENGVITSVGDSCSKPPGATSDLVLKLEGAVVIPGLIDAHAHASEYLLREITDDTLFGDERVKRLLAPFYANLTPEMEAKATKDFLLESLACGTTLVVDPMVVYPERVLEEVSGCSVRFMVGPYASSSGPLRVSPEEARIRLEMVVEISERSKMLLPVASTVDVIHASEELLQALADIVSSKELMFTSHFGFAGNELGRVVSSGISLDRTIVARVAGMNVNELVRAAREAAGLVVCPVTCMSNGGGLAWRTMLPELARIGAKIAFGSGGLSSPGTSDMLRIASTAALVFKDSRYNPKIVDAWWALSAVTSSSAAILGLGKKLGRIEEGLLGDLVVLDPRVRGGRSVDGEPQVYAVYRSGCHHVRYVVIHGELVVKEGQPLLSALSSNRAGST